MPKEPFSRYSTLKGSYSKSDANKNCNRTQILRLLSNNLIQLKLTFLHMATHESKNTPKSHLNSLISRPLKTQEDLML